MTANIGVRVSLTHRFTFCRVCTCFSWANLPLLKSLRQEGVPLQHWSPVPFFILGILRNLPEVHIRSQ
jgi:hypothetical protein